MEKFVLVIGVLIFTFNSHAQSGRSGDIDYDNGSGLKSQCTLLNDMNNFDLYNSTSNFDVDTIRRVENGAVLEVLDYPTVWYNSQGQEGIRFRVISNESTTNYSAEPGDILYAYKSIFVEICR